MRAAPVTGSRPVRRRGLAACLAALLGLVPGSLGAVEPKADDAHEVRVEDWRLTLQARQALVEDEALASYNLGVHVKAGVASVWGSVPSTAILQRATEKIRQVPGIHEVN